MLTVYLKKREPTLFHYEALVYLREETGKPTLYDSIA